MMAPAQVEAAIAGRIELGPERTVNRLGFGAMRITGPGIWGEPRDPDEARRVLRRALELGVDFIDTAHSYGPEVSERLIGEALHPYPDELLVATTSGLQRSGPNAWYPDGRPETIRYDCERSLTRLRRERIDLLQLHRVDPKVPIEESLGAMAALRVEGKVDLIGVSNVSVEQLGRARAITTSSPSRTGTPIPGTSSVAHLEENIAAAGLELSNVEFGRLGEQW